MLMELERAIKLSSDSIRWVTFLDWSDGNGVTTYQTAIEGVKIEVSKVKLVVVHKTVMHEYDCRESATAEKIYFSAKAAYEKRQAFILMNKEMNSRIEIANILRRYSDTL
jgi:hypothetical protein